MRRVGLAGVLYCPGLRSFVHSPSQVERLEIRARPLDPPQGVNDNMDSNHSPEWSDFTAC